MQFSCTCCPIQRVSFNCSHRTVCSEFWPCELSLELPRMSCQPQTLPCPMPRPVFFLASPFIRVKRNWLYGEEGSMGAQKAQGSPHTPAPVSICPVPICSFGVMESYRLAGLKGGAIAEASLSLAAWRLGPPRAPRPCCLPGCHPKASLPGGSLQNLNQERSRK